MHVFESRRYTNILQTIGAHDRIAPSQHQCEIIVLETEEGSCHNGCFLLYAFILEGQGHFS